MRQLIHISLLGLLLSLPTLSGAQQLFNNEFAPFEMRKDAEQRNREVKEYYMELTPQIFKSTESTHLARHIFTLPDKWTGRTITLHIENAGAAYDLVINNREVLANEDEATPTNINITKYLAQGENVIDFTLRESSAKSLQEGAATTQRVHFEGSYLSAQPYTHIHDFEIKLSPDSTKSFAYLDISVMVRNDFSAEESVDVGFDIYDPSGKLLDYSVDTFTIQAGAVDTIKFTPAISGKKENWWSTSSPKLHKVMIYTRRNGVVTEYVPRSVGLLDIEYKDGKLYNFGTPQQISIERYNAASTQSQSRTDLRGIKAKGHNTIAPDYAQPLWFYELCQELGFWVIDQVNINATSEPNNKTIGGTPSNDPSLKDEYIRRGMSTYFRSRDFGSVIAYSLGGYESGNGYNLYRLYEWLKSEESRRPILYRGAGGEWNSDTLE